MRWYDGFSNLENDGASSAGPGLQGPGLLPLAFVQVVVALADPTIASVAMRVAERSNISWSQGQQRQPRRVSAAAQI
jgi:hypothetical protein